MVLVNFALKAQRKTNISSSKESHILSGVAFSSNKQNFINLIFVSMSLGMAARLSITQQVCTPLEVLKETR